MIPEGQLLIEARVADARVAALEVRSSRRTEASRVLEGLVAQVALDRVPLLFSVCGKSQTLAARLALEGAMGVGWPREASAAVFSALVRLEALHEFLWRLLLDLPQQLKAAPLMADFAPLRGQILQAIKALTQSGDWKSLGRQPRLVGHEVLSTLVDAVSALFRQRLAGSDLDVLKGLDSPQALEGWLAAGDGPLAQWLRGLGREGQSPALLPAELTPAQVRELLSAAEVSDFAARPHWQGQEVETGALARQQGQPLVAALLAREGASLRVRWWARLLELAAVLADLRALATEAPCTPCFGGVTLGEGQAGAWVHTARGLLLHGTRLEGEKVARYSMVAPTEWNFHPRGVLQRELLGRPIADESALHRQLAELCLALDPCVAYQLEVCHA